MPHNVIFDGLLNFYLYCHNNNLQYGVLLRSVPHIFVNVSVQLTKIATYNLLFGFRSKYTLALISLMNAITFDACQLICISLIREYQIIFDEPNIPFSVSVPFLNINQTKNRIYHKKAAVRIGSICRLIITTIHLR